MKYICENVFKIKFQFFSIKKNFCKHLNVQSRCLYALTNANLMHNGAFPWLDPPFQKQFATCLPMRKFWIFPPFYLTSSTCSTRKTSRQYSVKVIFLQIICQTLQLQIFTAQWPIRICYCITCWIQRYYSFQGLWFSKSHLQTIESSPGFAIHAYFSITPRLCRHPL